MYKCLYLCSGHGVIRPSIPNVKVFYQDKYVKRDIGDDLVGFDLNGFDLLLISPPCNYWSRANYRRDTSSYSLATKHLLQYALDIAHSSNIPVIVENVKNRTLFERLINPYDLYVGKSHRHTFWANRPLDGIISTFIDEPVTNKDSADRQGGYEVQQTFENFLNTYILDRGDNYV